MDLKLYNDIIEVIKNHRGLSVECLKQLKAKFPNVNEDTISSILSHEYQKRMKQSNYRTPQNKNKFWDMYKKALQDREPSGVILRISEKVEVVPCLVAKLILQKYFEITPTKSGSEKEGQINVNTYMRDTNLIPDADLAYECFLCTIYDNLYSPLSETVRSSLGQQYEIQLNKEATLLGLAFRDEEYLRKQGYDKTPDIKLEVPVSIDGTIINWIESKALFGDADAHRDYIKNQYSSYWNRFGPGLVIYWFGFLASIVDESEKRFIIRDHLPTNVIKLSTFEFD